MLKKRYSIKNILYFLVIIHSYIFKNQEYIYKNNQNINENEKEYKDTFETNHIYNNKKNITRHDVIIYSYKNIQKDKGIQKFFLLENLKMHKKEFFFLIILIFSFMVYFFFISDITSNKSVLKKFDNIIKKEQKIKNQMEGENINKTKDNILLKIFFNTNETKENSVYQLIIFLLSKTLPLEFNDISIERYDFLVDVLKDLFNKSNIFFEKFLSNTSDWKKIIKEYQLNPQNKNLKNHQVEKNNNKNILEMIEVLCKNQEKIREMLKSYHFGEGGNEKNIEDQSLNFNFFKKEDSILVINFFKECCFHKKSIEYIIENYGKKNILEESFNINDEIIVLIELLRSLILFISEKKEKIKIHEEKNKNISDQNVDKDIFKESMTIISNLIKEFIKKKFLEYHLGKKEKKKTNYQRLPSSYENINKKLFHSIEEKEKEEKEKEEEDKEEEEEKEEFKNINIKKFFKNLNKFLIKWNKNSDSLLSVNKYLEEKVKGYNQCKKIFLKFLNKNNHQE
jgi:hypothetical protein